MTFRAHEPRKKEPRVILGSKAASGFDNLYYRNTHFGIQVAVAAEKLGIKKVSVYGLLATGRLRKIKSGHGVMVEGRSFEKYLRNKLTAK